MRIDKSKFKSLDALKKGAPVVCEQNPYLVKWMKDDMSPSGDTVSHMDFLSQFMPLIRGQCSKNIYMVSENLWRMSMENRDRMMKVLSTDWLKDNMGAILLPDGGMVCYFVHNIDEDEESYMRDNHTDLLEKERCKGMAVLILFNSNGRLIDVCFSANRLCYEVDNERRVMHDAPSKQSHNFANATLTLLAFMQYAETEQVVIENGQKKTYDKGVIQNASGYKVKFYDSRWIREIIRTEGFKVRGHFRLQPYKVNGEWTRKLIYIEEYKKHGYHRRATKNCK